MEQFDQATEDLIAAAPAPEVLAKSTLMLIRGEIPGRRLEMGIYGRETECGTTACLAGNAAMEAGFLPGWRDSYDSWSSVRATPGSPAEMTMLVGQRLLGLEDPGIFYVGNDEIEEAILNHWPSLRSET